jgi:hypothetical protein
MPGYRHTTVGFTASITDREGTADLLERDADVLMEFRLHDRDALPFRGELCPRADNEAAGDAASENPALHGGYNFKTQPYELPVFSVNVL